jgi:hypothetical protein
MVSAQYFFPRCLQILKESSRCYRDTRLSLSGAVSDDHQLADRCTDSLLPKFQFLKVLLQIARAREQALDYFR